MAKASALGRGVKSGAHGLLRKDLEDPGKLSGYCHPGKGPWHATHTRGNESVQ